MKIATFSIIVGTSICNAACPYCISKMTGTRELGTEEPEINWRNFQKACRLAQIHDVSTVLLTGKGEPTLYPDQLLHLLAELEPFNFPLIELQTNGISFGENYKKYERYLKEWYFRGLTMMAISIVHYDNQKNKEIYTPKRKYPNLKLTIDRLHNLGYSVRLTVTMVKGYSDTPEEVEKLIQTASDWRVEQVTIRPVRAVSEEEQAENIDVYQWTQKHLLPEENLIKIKDYLDKNGHKLMTLTHGALVYDLNGQNVCLTDALTIKPSTEDLRSLIFFPDGHLRYDWQYEGAILV